MCGRVAEAIPAVQSNDTVPENRSHGATATLEDNNDETKVHAQRMGRDWRYVVTVAFRR
jgi:hypothetical protein